jgi:hypothetical protein
VLDPSDSKIEEAKKNRIKINKLLMTQRGPTINLLLNPSIRLSIML